MTTLQIQGNLRERFIEDAVLLYILDPVRGEPSTYGLDQVELEGPREQLLKRKFLDSIALICAVKRDGDTVSAACLEEGRPEGTVLRIASNSGVALNTILQLQDLIHTLNNVASGVVKVSDVRDNVLQKIIQLDINKIQGYIKFLRRSTSLPEPSIAEIESRFRKSGSEGLLPRPQDFLDWFNHIFSIRDSLPTADPIIIAQHIEWAQKAKYNYLESLKVAFPWEDQLPRWISVIFKLGRYGIASKAVLQLPHRLPALFNPMTVESLPAPPTTQFCIELNALPLTRVLKRVVNEKALEVVKPQLARHWNTEDVEDFFQKSCTFDSVVHAELQLLSFYDNSPQLKPTFRFIGISKKTCYLCSLFLRAHPDNFDVSSCHQKLYPAWGPPPTVDVDVYRRYKTTIKDMSLAMEAIARQDLDTRLGIRRPSVADSTAGVSLGGLTDSPPSAALIRDYLRSQVAPAFQQDITMGGIETRGNISSQRLNHPTEVVGLTPSEFNFGSVRSDRTGRPESVEQDESNPLNAIVLHFVRSDDPRRQDVVCMNDIYDPKAQTRSWAKLVEILSNSEGFGVAFNEGSEFLLVNDIRVANERQFLACLQYLLNAGDMVAKVYICSDDLLA